MSQPAMGMRSQMTMIDPNQALKRMQISGQVTLQRKTYWVTRFAQIKESIFSYKKDSSKLSQARYALSLSPVILSLVQVSRRLAGS